MPTSKPIRILIAGGGTGGHVIPALAIGRELRDHHNAEVRYIGTARGLETKLVPEAGFPLELVRSGQLKNVSLLTRLKTFTDLPVGILHCIRLMRAFQPHAVVGVGGYASGPAMIAAILLRIPTVAYEPNAVPGLTNRLVGKRVRAAAVNFPQTIPYFRNAQVTGVPVRQEIFDIAPLPQGAPPRLLITAGSNGARVFNETLPQIAVALLAAVPGLTIVHQSGPRALEETTAAYTTTGANPASWSVHAFLTDMPQQYARASLVLARSGSTVAELAAAGKPSLLVPFPQAADDHQRRNAEVLVDAGAAVMLLQQDLTAPILLAELTRLLNSPQTLHTMSTAARSLARPGALQRIAELILSVTMTPQVPNP